MYAESRNDAGIFPGNVSTDRKNANSFLRLSTIASVIFTKRGRASCFKRIRSFYLAYFSSNPFIPASIKSFIITLFLLLLLLFAISSLHSFILAENFASSLTKYERQKSHVSIYNGNSVLPSQHDVIGSNSKHKYQYVHPSVAEKLLDKTVNLDLSNTDVNHLHGKYAFNESTYEPLWKPTPLKSYMSHEEKILAHTGYCFNSRVSASIPLDRTVPEYNSAQCLKEMYPDDLPKASVVIVFHNEDLSVLLRSFHSVLNRTPPHLLNEIILVDDNSNSSSHPWLLTDLERYLVRVPKTILRRLSTRHGLMGARMAGVEWATGPVIVFLDSHIETAQRWLEPLLAAIKKNPKDIVTPFIHTIEPDSFAYEQGVLTVLGFSWSLGQTHPNRPESNYHPMASPVMAGGLFAVDKKWFTDLGGYDKEMRLYGGEEMELGFKTWMCGGSLHALPCSRIGHVFRTNKYWNKQVYVVPGEEINRNKLRVAAVWMDEYEKIVQIATPPLPEPLDLGPLDEQKAVRRRLNCKSFQWYLDHIYPEAVQPNLEGAKIGAIRAIGIDACLDTLGSDPPFESIGLYPCHNYHGTQAFIHDKNGFIRLVNGNFMCMRVGKDSANFLDIKQRISATNNCDKHVWTYNNDTKQLNTEVNGKVMCLQALKQQTAKSPFDLIVAPCNNLTSQQFMYDGF